MNIEQKLKPVIFIKGDYNYHRQNDFQQNFILKALEITTDPEELRKMAGLKTVAEVYRTLDKLAIRKEYHEALLRAGYDLDSIVGGIKKAIDNSESGTIKLRGFQMLLKSLGLDTYDATAADTKNNWEETLKKRAEQEEDVPAKKLLEYDVVIPKTPEGEKERVSEDESMGESLYE